jgi:electron transfer flavoprotein alpha subunit
VAVSTAGGEEGQKLIHYGADKVLTFPEQAFKPFQIDVYTDAFANLATERKPDVILIGATRTGLEFAPRLAERLKTACITEATRLEPDADKKYLLAYRVTMGGNLTETQISKTTPEIVTVPKGLFSSLQPDTSRKGEVITVDPKFKPPSTKLVETKPKPAKGVKLSDA